MTSKIDALREYQQMETDKKLERIFEVLWDFHGEITTLKAEMRVKSGVWGIIGGCIPVLISLLIGLFIWLVRS